MKSNLKEKIIAGSIITSIAICFMFVFGLFSFNKVEASSIFGGTCKTASATTTLSYMTTGAATTTLSCFTGSDAMLSANLRIRFVASSTSSTLGWRYEYSNDGVDWYGDAYVDAVTNATTTQAFDLSTNNSYAWKFASSTQVCNGNLLLGTNNSGCKSTFIPTPSRFVRVVFYLPAGSTAGAVWAELTPKGDI